MLEQDFHQLLSYNEEELNFALSQFSLELESSTKLLHELDHRITDLATKQSSLTTSLSEKDQLYSDLQTHLSDIPRPHSLPDSSGSYFYQMNALELMESELRGEIAGRTSAIHKLTDSVKSQSQKNQRLGQQLADLRSTLTQISPPKPASKSSKRTSPRAAPPKSADPALLRAHLSDLTQDITRARATIDSLRDAIREKNARLQAISADLQVADLIEQKEALDRQIAAKRKELNSLRQREREGRSRDSREINAQRSIMEGIEQTDYDEERRRLQGMVAQARADLRQLGEQQAGTRQSSGTQQSSRKVKKRRANLDEMAIRKAIRLEIEALQGKDDPLVVAIRAENAYGERLDGEIERAELTFREIEEFANQTLRKFQKMEEEQEESRNQELFVLTQEYEELMEELKRLK